MNKKNGFKVFQKKLYKYRIYLLMLAPAVLYTLIFAYYPMTGIVMAFKKQLCRRDLGQSVEWAGELQVFFQIRTGRFGNAQYGIV